MQDARGNVWYLGEQTTEYENGVPSSTGEAEDRAEILGVDEQAEVPFGHFEHVVLTRDLNPLEPKLVELTFSAPGIGPVLAVAVSGSSDREELVRYDP